MDDIFTPTKIFLSIWKFQNFFKYLKRTERARERLRNSEKWRETHQWESLTHPPPICLPGRKSLRLNLRPPFPALALTRYQLFLSFSLSQRKNVLLGLFTFTHCVCVCLSLSVFALILSRPIRSAKSSMEVSSLTKKLRAYWKSKKDSSFLLLFTPKLSLFYFQIIISLHALSLSQFAIRSNPSKFFGQSLFFFVNSWSVL